MGRPGRPPFRLLTLEDRATPAAGFAAALGGAPLGEGKALAVTPAGDAVYAGTANPDDPAAPALVVAKYAADGTPLWSRPFGQGVLWGQVRGVAADPAGDVYVAGVFVGTGDFDPGPSVSSLTAPPRNWAGEVHIQIEPVNTFVAKFDPAGTFLWAKGLGAGGVAEAAGIGVDAAGNAVVVGQLFGRPDFDPGPRVKPLNSQGDPDAFVVKLTPAGDLAWARAFGGPGYSAARDVAVDPDGAIFVGGSFNGDVRFSDTKTATAPGSLGAYLARLTPDGAVAWAQTIAGPGATDLAAVASDGAGAVYAAGTFTDTAVFGPFALTAAGDGPSAFVAKISRPGAPAWARGIDGEVEPSDVAADAAGVAVTGTFRGTADFDPGPKALNLTSVDQGDVFLGRLAPDGTLKWAEAAGGPGEDRGEAVGLAGGTVYVAGSFQGELAFPGPDGSPTLDAGEDTDAFLVRLSPPPPANLPPTVTVDGTFAIVEGQPLALSAVAADREGDPLTIVWDVNGDGDFTDAAGPAPTLTWDRLRRLGVTDSTAGRPMTVKVSDGVNPPVVVGLTLLIDSAPPTATFRAGQPIREGTAGYVSFAGQADPSAADRAAGFRYSYDFDADGKWDDLGDGKTFAGSVPAAAAAVPAVYLRDSGPHTVRARILDKDGAYSEYTAIITVANVAPAGKLATDGQVPEGQSALVRFVGVSDPSPADTRAGFRYSYDFNADGVFDLGDGISYAGSIPTGQVRVPTTFLADGGRTVSVRARVFDRDGGWSESVVPIQVRNVAPTATFRVLGPVELGKPITVGFGGRADPSAADRAAGFTYSFDFDGDGRYELTGTNPRAAHVFARPGTYRVRGRITDKDGGSTAYELTLTVSPPAVGKLVTTGDVQAD